MRAILGQPVVVGQKAGAPQFRVFELKQRHRQARIQHLAGDAVALLVGDAQGGIPGAGPDAGVAARHAVRKFAGIEPGHGEAGDREGGQPLGHEQIGRTAVKILLHDFGRALAQGERHARGPQLGRFYDVRVGRNDGEVRHALQNLRF